MSSELTIIRGIVPTHLIVFFWIMATFAVLGFSISAKVMIGDMHLVVPSYSVGGLRTILINAAIVATGGIAFVLFFYIAIQTIIKRSMLAVIHHKKRSPDSASASQ